VAPFFFHCTPLHSVPDTSEYPRHHTYFSFSPDPDLSSNVRQVIENVFSGRSLPIQDAIRRLLSALSRVLNANGQFDQGTRVSQDIEVEAEADEDEDYDMYDADDGLGGITIPDHVVKQIFRLKQYVLETVWRLPCNRTGTAYDHVVILSKHSPQDIVPVTSVSAETILRYPFLSQ
jgi:hypothetical protein